MTQNSTGGATKDAADQNFDYMFKLLIIGNSSVGKTSFVCFFNLFYLCFHETNICLKKKIFYFSCFDMPMIHLHQLLLVPLALILRLKLYFAMINVLNCKYGIQLVKNDIEQ